jgi:hypothetical protein
MWWGLRVGWTKTLSWKHIAVLIIGNQMKVQSVEIDVLYNAL